MEHHLPFHEVIPARKWQRKGDLSSFEYTYKAEISSIYRLTDFENLYRIRLTNDDDRRHFTFLPGQFIMLEVPGVGEAPFSISSSPSNHEDIELCIRTAGNLTGYLARGSRGMHIGIRGPFGTSFPMERMHGGNILLIAGGLGLAPLRSPIAHVQEHRSRFNNVDIVYGTRDSSRLLFTFQYEMWKKDDINLHLILEKADPGWTGPVGLITKVLDEIVNSRDESFIDNTYAIVCGPPVMFKSICTMLSEHDVPMQKMFVSLERRMHCGMGKCCRCNVGSTYTCLSGPVFDYWTVMNLKEAI
jgi:sulfhydrogenase subunit gamma (sulfur reductase)